MLRPALLILGCLLGSLGCSREPEKTPIAVQPPLVKSDSETKNTPLPTGKAPSPKLEPKKETDRDLLQGFWLVAKSTVNGVPHEFGLRDQCVASVSDHEFGFKLEKDFFDFDFTLDPSAEPKKMDLVNGREPKVRQKAIYRIDQDGFTVCLAFQGDRPEEFLAPQGSGRLLVHFRRLNATEEKILAGALPENEWVKQASAAGRCELSFPLAPVVQSSEFSSDMVLFLTKSYYHFSCSIVRDQNEADAQYLKRKLHRIAESQGKLISSTESTTEDGHANLHFRLDLKDSNNAMEGRLLVAHGSYYQTYVTGPKAFIDAPNAKYFLNSLTFRGGPTVKELMRQFMSIDADVHNTTVKLLKAKGPKIVPELQEGLQDSNDRIRSGSAEVLRHFGNAAKGAVPQLEKALHDQNSFVRSDVRRALESIGTPAIATLVKALPDNRGDFYELISALRKIDPNWQETEEAKSAIPTLIQRLSAPNPDTRHWAISALREMGPSAKESVPHVAPFLFDKNPDIRGTAASMMTVMKEHAVGAKKELLKALGDSVPSTRTNAAKALGGIGPVVVADLREALTSMNRDIRVSVVDAMGWLGPQGKDVVPDLIGLLNDKNPYVKIAAIDALGNLGPLAVDAVPALEANKKSIYFDSASKALNRIQK